MMDKYGVDPGITSGSAPQNEMNWWSQNCHNSSLCWELRRKYGIKPGFRVGSFGSTPEKYQTIWERECRSTNAYLP